VSIHPLVLGQGRGMFPADGPRMDLRLARAVTSTTGVIIATYTRGDGSGTG
jgi:hypothetical protein